MGISPTLAINQLVKEREQSGLETFKLGFGQSPFPVPQILVDRLKACAHIKDYLPTQGLETLRESIAEHYRNQKFSDIDASDIVIGPGSKELIFLSQMCLDRELILPSPSWVSYAPQAKLLNKPVHWIHSHKTQKWQLTAEALENFLQKNASKKYFLILNYPNNPSGATFSETELKDIAAVARKHDLIIIADEIYAEFEFHGAHKSIYNYYPEGSIVCNGLSKWCGAGGWRLGYMIFPKKLAVLKTSVIQAGSETYSCASAPIQNAAIEAFSNHDSIHAYTQTARIILQYASSYIHQNLDESKVSMAMPEGGFYGFLEFNGTYFQDTSSTSLCQRILNETGVALLPGSAFGRDPKELTARLAFVDFDGNMVYNSQIIADSAKGILYLEIPKIREAVNRLNSLNSFL